MKKVIVFIEIVIVVLIIAAVIIFFVPGAKTKALKGFLGCSLGKSISSCMVGEEYQSSVQDTNYHESSIIINEGLDIPGNYTNVVLIGGDDSGEMPSGFLGEGAHSDSLIVLNINNDSGETKMVSVYRDTYLEYTVREKNYGKATNALYFGGVTSSVNMLNKNLDLNIRDYVVINYSGLGSLIDQLGGITLNISEDEKKYINLYLEDLRVRTGKEALDLEDSGEALLTGMQAVAYCRIRQVEFINSEEMVFYDDYGRAERQRFVLQRILEKVKEMEIFELFDMSKILLQENEGEEKFITTSLTLDETLDLLRIALDLKSYESQGFPINRETRHMSGGDSIIPKTLESNVIALHEYLFDTQNYKPTDTVKEISKAIISHTGIE